MKKKSLISLFILIALLFVGCSKDADSNEALKSTDPAISTKDTAVTTTQNLDEGYEISFNLGENVSVKVYTTKDFSLETNEYLSRDSETGNPLSDGNGQINFELVFSEGYDLASISIDGDYNKIKTSVTDPDDLKNNQYRVTKIASELTINVTAKKAIEATTGYEVKFIPDANATIYIYDTQDYTTEPTNTLIAESKDTSGTPCKDGTGQINFKIVCASGYIVDTILIAEETYGNLKGPNDTGAENVYRITKITGDLNVTITTKEESSVENLIVTFITDSNAAVYVYDSQDYTIEPVLANTCNVKSDTGVICNDGSGQVNFKIVCAEGYKVSAVTITGNYNKLKTPEDLELEGVYRITKVSGNLTVTITVELE